MRADRYERNPIITASDVSPSFPGLEVIGVFNAGAVRVGDKTVLLLRVAERAVSDGHTAGVPVFDAGTGRFGIKKFRLSDARYDFSDVRFVRGENELYLTSISHLKIAESRDGVNFKISETPFMTASEPYEEYGVEDPRIAEIGGKYYITYSAISRSGVVTALAETTDFSSVKRKGVIFLPDNKDVTLFPEKIGGKFYALHRPVSAYFLTPEMWISASDDLTGFYGHTPLARLRPGRFDSARIGASCVPIKTEDGWLEIYHGCDARDRYCLGAMLLDLNKPWKILARSEKPLLEPEKDYEKNGFMPEVVFSCGATEESGILSVYYGCCDQSIALARFVINDILAGLKAQTQAA